MNTPATIKVYEGSDVTTVARITLPNGVTLDRDDVAADPSIKLYVYDITDGSSTLTTAYDQAGTASLEEDTTLAKATAITTADQTLTTDGWWTVDSTGYNFKHSLTGAALADGGKKYQLEYHITTGSYGTVYVLTKVETQNLMSS